MSATTNKIILVSHYLLLLLFFTSCDTIEFPYIPPKPGTSADTVQKVQRVLLEEYTGHTCGNCPEGALTAQGLKQYYGDKLVLITIHNSKPPEFYALPIAPPYEYDFRTSVGETYATTFNIITHPVGMVNRIGYPGNCQKTPGSWSAVVDSLVNSTPQLYMEISNSFNSATRKLDTKVKLNVLDTLNGVFNLVLLFVEDSIQKAQKDYTKTDEDVLDYWHKHTVRDAITSHWGDEVITASLPGEKIDKEYSFTVPENYFGYSTRFDRCYVVAYVYDNTPPSPNYRILQVVEKTIK